MLLWHLLAGNCRWVNCDVDAETIYRTAPINKISDSITTTVRADISHAFNHFINLWAFSLDWVFNLTSKWEAMLTESQCETHRRYVAWINPFLPTGHLGNGMNNIHILSFSSSSVIRLSANVSVNASEMEERDRWADLTAEHNQRPHSTMWR